jgi:hypothetical protein
VLALVDHSLSQALTLSVKQRERCTAELVQVAKIVELEEVMKSQADKIAELEAV